MPEEKLREVYSDVFRVTMSPYTVLLQFGVKSPPPRQQPEAQEETPSQEDETVAVVRMSPEHAKVMAILLRRHIQNYEQQTGITIDVPTSILQSLNIPPEDWRQFGG